MPTRRERLRPWWLVATSAVIVLLVMTVFATIHASRRACGCEASRRTIAVKAITKFAREAYPLWGAAHPWRSCPATIDELYEWADRTDGKDPWGSRYEMRCVTGGIQVWSPGEDRIEGTADDLRSWD